MNLPRSAQWEWLLDVYRALVPRGIYIHSPFRQTTLTHLGYAMLKEVSCGSIFFLSASGSSYWESTYIRHKQLFPYLLVTIASNKTLEFLCLLGGHKTNSSGVHLKWMDCLCFTQRHNLMGKIEGFLILHSYGSCLPLAFKLYLS